MVRSAALVLRFSTDDVRGNLNGVVGDIIRTLETPRRAKEGAVNRGASRLDHSPSP